MLSTRSASCRTNSSRPRPNRAKPVPHYSRRSGPRRLASGTGGGVKYLGLTPFALYVILFLAVPTIIALGTRFFDGDGALPLDNVGALFDPVILGTFFSSFWVSAVTAVVGAVVGALVCYAMLGTKPDGVLRP